MDDIKLDFKDFPKFLAQEYPNDKSWMAFFKMWLDAKGFDYGRDDEFIVDGSGDGGIDAIAYPPRGYKELNTVVVQSKNFNGQIPDQSLNSFLNAVTA